MKRKKTERRKLIEKISRLAKDIAKDRDKRICQYCGKSVTGFSCHGSHIIPVSADHRLEFHPINIKCLCYHCHLNVWHKNPLEMGTWYEEAFPDKADWLRKQRIVNKVLGTIRVAWLEEWFEVLKGIENYSSEEIIAWEKEYIDAEIHNWI